MQGNEVGRQQLLLFGTAAVLRLALVVAFPALPNFLSGRVEISTPVTSFKRLQEGLFLNKHGLDPYDGGVFHQAPLFLPLFTLLQAITGSGLTTHALYIVLDLLSASALVQIAESSEAVSSRHFSSPRKERRWGSTAIAASYLFNPLIILTCLGRSTSVFSTFFVLQATAKACSGASTSSALALALAAYNSLQPALLFPPLALLCHNRSIARAGKGATEAGASKSLALSAFLLRQALLFTIFVGILLGLSCAMMGSWSFIPAVYGTRLLLPDLTPNVGLWWYFFIEMFDSFRSFFLGVFWLHMASYSPGLTIRLHTQPLAVVVLLFGIFAVFQPYANVGDAGAWMAMLTLYGHVFELTRYTFPALSSLLYSTLLGPAFYYLWIYAGSGNANFFYAITLVWSLGLLVILADMLYAILRDEWEESRPEMKGKDAARI